MSLTAEFEYRLDDFKVCAKGMRLSQGAKFYIKTAGGMLLMIVACALMCTLAEQMGRFSVEEDWLVRDILYVACEVWYIFTCTDRHKAKNFLRTINKIKRVHINDDGVKMIFDYGESLICYQSITKLYFSKGVWLVFYEVDTAGKSQYVITVPARGLTEGDPAQFGAYLSRMCGKEVKSF